MSDRPGATIFALSTAGLPSAIAIVRVSGSQATEAVRHIAGELPAPRQATLRTLRDPQDRTPIDQALVLFFPGPDSATGEDVAEFHIHGSRAVAAKLLDCLGRIDGLRPAQAGEFTRRAFLNGRIDLSAAEGLGDLLVAETEQQRRHALRIADGGLAARIDGWRERLLAAEARLEAVLNFSDEGDVTVEDERHALDVAQVVSAEIDAALAAPPAERIRDGVRVALAGPPNSGKSTLFNALLEREAAIVSEQAGTTRDVLEAAIDMDGIAVLLLDTAGIRATVDAIEGEGVRRAETAVAGADFIVWLGETTPPRVDAIWLRPKADLEGGNDSKVRLSVSAVTGKGLGDVHEAIVHLARSLLPRDDQLALNARHRDALRSALSKLREAKPGDWVILSELLRLARADLDLVSGRTGVEEMLDALFGRFCIGK